MSEEKLYVVKNDEGKYLDIDLPIWWDDKAGSAFKRIDLAFRWAKKYDGHVVTLIEEPKKVVLSEKQAGIVDTARVSDIPATYISARTDEYNGEESLLMNAYVNGYIVAKEKKYRLPVPKSWCGDNDHYWRKESDGTLTWSILSGRAEDFEFTKDEIGKFELQDCEKEEVTDDDD